MNVPRVALDFRGEIRLTCHDDNMATFILDRLLNGKEPASLLSSRMVNLSIRQTLKEFVADGISRMGMSMTLQSIVSRVIIVFAEIEPQSFPSSFLQA